MARANLPCMPTKSRSPLGPIRRRCFEASSDGRPERRAATWFSYDLTLAGGVPAAIVVTCNRDNRHARSFDVRVDGSASPTSALRSTANRDRTIASILCRRRWSRARRPSRSDSKPRMATTSRRSTAAPDSLRRIA
jgi:hypothetical protein